MMSRTAAAVAARVWRPSLVILLSQQTNMFEARAAIAKHAPQAISNVQKILIFLASKNKTNKREAGGGKITSMSSGTAPFFYLKTLRSHGTCDDFFHTHKNQGLLHLKHYLKNKQGFKD